jgi:hypothetical protein
MTNYYRIEWIIALIICLICFAVSAASMVLMIPMAAMISAACSGIFAEICGQAYNEYCVWKRLEEECFKDKEDEDDASE